MLSLATLCSPAHAVAFTQPNNFPAPASGSWLLSGDVNGDGLPDLVGMSSAGIVVALNQGNDQFAEPYTIANTAGFHPLAVADINHDGKADIVYYFFNGDFAQIATLIGLGGGVNFKAPVKVGYKFAGTISELHVVDVNGDGKMDLVFVVQYSSGKDPQRIETVIGKGTGAFSGLLTVASGAYNSDNIVVADMNGDGYPDIVCTGYPTNGTVFFNNGAGSFTTSASFGINSYSTCLAVGDINGDGRPDIVSEDINIVEAINQGNGTFALSMASNPGTNAYRLDLVDMNGDHKLDIVAYSYDGVAIQLGHGDGTFDAPGQIAYLTNQCKKQIVTDIDGNGTPDVLEFATASQDATKLGEVTILPGNGDGTLIGPVTYRAVAGDSIGTGDFNKDGIRDIVTADERNLYVSLGNGDGTFKPAVTYNVGYGLEKIIVQDFNNDGNPDIGVAFDGQSTNFYILFGNGDGTFKAPVADNIDYGASYIATADFNHDGYPDIVVTPETTVALNDGTGHFPTSSTYESNGIGLATGDFDGDGNMDFVTAESTGLNQGALLEYLGNGDGTFKTPISFTLPDQPTDLVAGDFNNDGKLDIVVSINSGLAILLNNGSGGFTITKTAVAGGHLKVGDFNRDGNLDLAFTSAPDGFDGADGFVGGTATILPGTGHGSFRAPAYLTIPGDPYDLVVGNFNTDSKLDLAVVGDGGLAVLLNQPLVAQAATASPKTVTGATTTHLSALGSYAAYGGESNLTYSWSATGPATVSFSANSTNQAKMTTAMFTKIGTYVFTVTIADTMGDTASSNVTVQVKSL